jgi:GNAT superfamily N-acetyltransferase
MTAILELPDHDLRRATDADVAAIQALFELDPGYFEIKHGAPPRPTEARALVGLVPVGLSLDRRHLLVIDDARTGVIDLLEGYPDAATWFLGAIFLTPAARGRGLGRRLLDAMAGTTREGGATGLRLIVSVQNPRARQLYDRHGFQPIMRYPQTSWTGSLREVDLLELDVTASRAGA